MTSVTPFTHPLFYFSHCAIQIVISLADTILGKGHTIVTDNYFTGSELGRKLYETHHTHLLGTIRINRAGLPKNFSKEPLPVCLPPSSVPTYADSCICRSGAVASSTETMRHC
jgi:Transposase IS4